MTRKTDTSDILRWMRVSAMILLVIALSPFAASCDNDDPWDEVPQKITMFVNQYYPDSELGSYSYTDDSYHLRLKNGPGFSFDKACNWVTVNGYGMPIVQVFLFDQLPPKLFNYLDETEQTDDVFSVTHEGDIYTLSLLESTLRYNSETEEIIGSDASGGNAK